MRILVRLLTPALIAVVLGIISYCIEKKNDEEFVKNSNREHVIVRLPDFYLWLGCISNVFFILLVLLFQNGSEPLWVWIGYGLFLLLGFILIIERLFWKIDIFRNKDYFVYRTFFCRTHQIRYQDCIGYKTTTNTLFLKTHKKTFVIDNHAVNFEIFLDLLTRHKVREQRKS